MAKPTNEPQLVYVEAVLMPNGEVISEDKTLGWSDKIKCVAAILEVKKDCVVIEKINRNH